MAKRSNSILSPFDYVEEGEVTVNITLSEYRELLKSYLTHEDEVKRTRDLYEGEIYRRDCEIEKLKVKLNRATGVE